MRGVDTELVKRAQHGDKEAFGLVAADLATRFLAVSRRILRDIGLAEDATQQALVAIWRDLPQLRDPARFDAWSYRLLVHACYAEGRRSRQWSPNLRILPADELAASGGVDTIIHRDELETAIRRLSVDHRTVLVLHHFADIPAELVAQILDIPIGTVYSRLHHAMRAMRAALDAEERPAAREASTASRIATSEPLSSRVPRPQITRSSPSPVMLASNGGCIHPSSVAATTS